MILDKHFVEFYSPGIFISEVLCEPIDSWDPQKATIMTYSLGENDKVVDKNGNIL